MPRCQIGLGGNLGSVPATFRRALDLLANSSLTLTAVSPFYRTSAVGDRAKGVFFNAAASLDTVLTPFEVLDRLQAIEAQLGRTREVRWGSRTIDLDLLCYGGESFETPRLTVPHPACWYRRFVLDPFTDIAPDLVHPVKHRSIRNLRDRLRLRPLPVAFAGADAQARAELVDRLSPEFPQAEFFAWPVTQGDIGHRSTMEPAFIFWLECTPQERDDGSDFAALPALPRVFVSATTESADASIRAVLQSALDEPIVSD